MAILGVCPASPSTYLPNSRSTGHISTRPAPNPPAIRAGLPAYTSIPHARSTDSTSTHIPWLTKSPTIKPIASGTVRL